MRIRDLKVSAVPVPALKPYRRNPRTHSKKQIRQIAASIQAFGWTNPILIDGEEVIIAGHGRLKAAMSLGIDRVPAICIDDMTEAQKRAYILADNKLAENAGWYPDLLALELQGLIEMELDFDVTTTGFEMGEIDLLIGGSGEADVADEITGLDRSRAAGHAARRSLEAGSAPHALRGRRETEILGSLMRGEQAQMIFTDPPYNVPIEGHVSWARVIKAFRVRDGIGRDE